MNTQASRCSIACSPSFTISDRGFGSDWNLSHSASAAAFGGIIACNAHPIAANAIALRTAAAGALDPGSLTPPLFRFLRMQQPRLLASAPGSQRASADVQRACVAHPVVHAISTVPRSCTGVLLLEEI
eukprot:COSAG06_NODE_2043_length_7761_cov_6.844166_3_plen_128_part_00